MREREKLQVALRVAYRNSKVSEMERDAVLVSMARYLPNAEAETAARLLHHRRQAAELQLTLDGLVTDSVTATKP